MPSKVDDLTLGRGELWFAPFAPGTQNPIGERYLGNTPEFNVTISATYLDHYSSDHGIKELDQDVTLQVDRSGSLVTDNIEPANVALFFFGSADALTQGADTVTAEAHADVELGLTYQLGVDALNPAGVRGLDTVGFAVKKGATTFVLDTDYTIDYDLARLTPLVGGAIVAGDDITVDYHVKAHTRTRIISGNQAVEGQLRFIATNPVGGLTDYLMPWVKLTPNGDFQLKGDDWQKLPLNLKVLKKGALAAFYGDGRPVYS